jgi:hypothetical protein
MIITPTGQNQPRKPLFMGLRLAALTKITGKMLNRINSTGNLTYARIPEQ